MSNALENARALYYTGIRDGRPREAAERYTGDRYTQHSTGVKDGREGFIEFFETFIERNPERDIEIVRSFQDGPYVFMHARQSLNGGESRWITMDILEADEQDRMIEHWDVIAEWVDDTVSDHSQTDGPATPTDLDRTEENKALVAAFIQDVFTDGKLDRVTDYVSSETYIQHDPLVADGLEGLADFLESLAESGQSMRYLETRLLIGSGDLVAALSRMELGGTEMAVIDLFRVADGRLVEHWDVLEPVPPADELVNSGKF